jgi:hypothetical protein
VEKVKRCEYFLKDVWDKSIGIKLGVLKKDQDPSTQWRNVRALSSASHPPTFQNIIKKVSGKSMGSQP